jgi:hypothetical protein
VSAIFAHPGGIAHNAKDWTGQTFGELTVVRPARCGGGWWIMRCRRGHEVSNKPHILARHARNGKPCMCPTCKATHAARIVP